MESLKGLYHPDKQDERSFISNFTIRVKEYNQIIENLQRQKKKPLQHFLITGKRGMGKSTLLRRIHIEASRPPLNEKMVVVRLGGEQYRLSRLFKLWEMVIEHVGENIPELLTKKNEIEKSKQYETTLLPLINDYLNQADKTLLLLVDNFDQFIEKIPSIDRHALREALTLYPIQIIGNALFYNEHFIKYENPFFDFFKPVRLENLDKEEANKFIKQRAVMEGMNDFGKIFENQKGKIHALRILSGGVPRTLLILLSIVSKKNTGDAVEYLHEMIEQVTPLYQDRMKALSSQQQEIMHHLALRWDKTPVKDIATEMRIPSKSISAQLIQLEKIGYIKKVESPGRNRYYEIDERFFNIWLLMSEAPLYDTKRVIWLTKWLDAYYSADELRDFAFYCETNLEKNKPFDRFLIAQALSESERLEYRYKKKLVQQTAEDVREKIPEVEVWFKSFTKKSTDQVYKLIQEIKGLADMGNIQEAMSLADHLEAIDDVAAYFVKGGLYYRVNNIPEAEKYYLMSAEKGNSDAMSNLGYLYDEVKRDFVNAEKYYLMAAEKGNSYAMSNLGYLYQNEKLDINNAEKYYLMAVEKGHRGAMFNLGYLYDEVKRDIVNGEKYYLMAVENGYSDAMINLGNLYRNEKQDIVNAEKYYLMAVERGDSDAMFNLGNLYRNEKHDSVNAEKYYLMAMEKGDSGAMYNLGYLYHSEKHDIVNAEKYYLMAVEKGNSDAMNNLGHLYYSEKQDIDNAEKYYLMAVEKGNGGAMHNLGYLYSNVKQDIVNAEKYYLMAVEKEKANSMGNLAGLYFDTNNILQKKKAYELSAKAVELTAGSNAIDLQIYIKILLWNGKLKEANQSITGLLTGILHTDDNAGIVSSALLYFLIFKQRHFLYKLFASNTEWIDRYKPVYYALLNEMQDEHSKEYLKMPSELEEPVKDLLDLVSEERNRLGI